MKEVVLTYDYPIVIISVIIAAFLSPLTLGLIIFMFVTEAVTLTTGLILTVILVSVTILQLLDTHRKWKREEVNDGEG